MTPEEWSVILLSLKVSLVAVLLTLPVAFALAWLLARGRFPGRMLLDALVHLPLVVPPVVVGWGLLMLFGIRGPIGGPLHDWFGIRLVFTTEGAALATAVMSFPLIVRAVRLGIESIDPGLEAAARTLGAGPVDRFLTVTLPLMSPGILAGAVTAFAAGLGEFGAVITFVSNIPGETQTLPLAIYSATQTAGGEGTAARLAGIAFGTNGPAGRLLADWFGLSFMFRWTGAALAAAIMALPLMVRAMRLSIESVDQRLEGAARTLGAGPTRTFLSITLPLAMPGVLAGAVLGFARWIGEFGATITFVSNIPGETRTIPIAIYGALQIPGNEAEVTRLAIIAVLLSLGALLVSELLTRRMGPGKGGHVL